MIGREASVETLSITGIAKINLVAIIQIFLHWSKWHDKDSMKKIAAGKMSIIKLVGSPFRVVSRSRQNNNLIRFHHGRGILSDPRVASQSNLIRPIEFASTVSLRSPQPMRASFCVNTIYSKRNCSSTLAKSDSTVWQMGTTNSV